MAGSAQSAVDSLLGTLATVISDEAKLLGGVRCDVQFIKDEMESMNGFLLDVAQDAHPNNQVRGWMRQVRDVAYDCQNCIDRYVQTFGASRPSAGLMGSLQRVPQLTRSMPDRHRIATQIRELRTRAREVGERRQRYGVKVVVPPREACVVATGGTQEEEEQEEEDERRSIALADAGNIVDVDATAREIITWMRWERCDLPESSSHGYEWKPKSKYDKLVVELIKLGRALMAEKDAQRRLARAEGDLKHGDRGEQLAFGEWPTAERRQKQCKEHVRLAREKATKLWEKNEKTKQDVKELLHEMSIEKEGVTWLMDKLLSLGGDKLAASSSTSSQQEAAPSTSAEAWEEVASPSVLELQYVEELIRWLRGVFGADQMRGRQHRLLAIVPPPFDASNPEVHKRATDLARKVYDHPGATCHFDCRVSVDARLHSQRTERLRCILQQLEGNNQMSTSWDDRRLEQEIQKHLKGKRKFLIVMADHEDSSPWVDITDALPHDHYGYTIVTPVIQQTPHLHGWYIASCLFSLRGSGSCHVHLCSYLDAARRKAADLLLRGGSDRTQELWDTIDNILKKCRWDSFSTNMVLHALYANPQRRKEDFENLLRILTDSSTSSNAKQTIRFCYDELASHHKACLLYLSIFPQRSPRIRRTTLVRRWVAESLITRRHELSALDEAERCFGALLDRGLVLPCDISPGGKVKSCRVHPHVFSFITKIAQEENFRNTNLQPEFARCFSIRSGIQLQQLSNKPTHSICWRSPQKKHHVVIEEDPLYGVVTLLNLLPASSQLGSIKVLDLEGCKGLNKKNLKSICNKLFQVKYLSLRNTDATELPKEIDKLRYLETFDIRQTKIQSFPPRAVIMLQKLVQLLAGHIGSDGSFSTIHLPRGVGSMTNIQILSHVEVVDEVDEHALAELGRLQRLRKLGVVIHGKEACLLIFLLWVIGKLNECLRSFSLRIEPVNVAARGVFRSKKHGEGEADDMNTNDATFSPPKSLTSISINGWISGLPTWIKELHKLSKVTLCGTYLMESDIRMLGTLVNLRCIRLGINSYNEKKLALKNKEFQKLRFLVVDDSNITEIYFDPNATPKLEKIVWTYTSTNTPGCLSGIGKLPSLNEIELKGSFDMARITQDIMANPNYPRLTHT